MQYIYEQMNKWIVQDQLEDEQKKKLSSEVEVLGKERKKPVVCVLQCVRRASECVWTRARRK